MAEALPEDKARTAAVKMVAWVFIVGRSMMFECLRVAKFESVAASGVWCVARRRRAAFERVDVLPRDAPVALPRQAEEPKKQKNLTVGHPLSHETGNAHLFRTALSRIVDKDDE